jgi:hypothetical protein
VATLKKVKSSMEGMISAKIKDEKAAKVILKKYQYGTGVWCCGSGMFIPDPHFFLPGSASKNLSILTQKFV